MKITDLPSEITEHIISFLEIRDAVKYAQTCKSGYSVYLLRFHSLLKTLRLNEKELPPDPKRLRSRDSIYYVEHYNIINPFLIVFRLEYVLKNKLFLKHPDLYKHVFNEWSSILRRRSSTRYGDKIEENGGPANWISYFYNPIQIKMFLLGWKHTPHYGKIILIKNTNERFQDFLYTFKTKYYINNPEPDPDYFPNPTGTPHSKRAKEIRKFIDDFFDVEDRGPCRFHKITPKE